MLVTLNIGSRDLRLVASRDNKIIKWGTARLDPGLIKDGRILQVQDVARAIDSLFDSVKVPKNQVIACIEGLSFTYRTLNLPRMKSSLMNEAIQRAARKEIPIPLEDLYLTWLITGGDDVVVEVLTLGAPRSLIDTAVETFNKAGVGLSALGLKSLALARTAGIPNAIIVDFEPDCFDIVIESEGMPAIMHTVTPHGDKSSLEDNVSQLVNELNRTIEFHNITHTVNPIKPDMPLLLSGSLAMEASVAELIRKGTGHPIEPLTTGLPLPADFPIALYACNVGLLLKRPGQKTSQKRDKEKFYDINIDFLAARRRALARPVSIRSMVLPSVLVILILLLIPVYFVRNNTANQVGYLQSDADRLNRNIRTARLINDEAVKTEADIQKLLEGTKSLEKSHTLISGKRDTSASLQSVFNKLPGSAYYTGIDITTDQITIDGKTTNRADVIKYAVDLEKNPGVSEARIARIQQDEQGGEGVGGGFSFTIILER